MPAVSTRSSLSDRHPLAAATMSWIARLSAPAPMGLLARRTSALSSRLSPRGLANGAQAGALGHGLCANLARALRPQWRSYATAPLVSAVGERARLPEPSAALRPPRRSVMPLWCQGCSPLPLTSARGHSHALPLASRNIPSRVQGRRRGAQAVGQAAGRLRRAAWQPRLSRRACPTSGSVPLRAARASASLVAASAGSTPRCAWKGSCGRRASGRLSR